MPIRPKQYTILLAGDMSQATLTSSSVDMTEFAIGAIQAVYTGSPVGTFKLQISNDNSTFSDYTGSSNAITVAGDFMWNLVDAGYSYVRLVYTKTSGTGSVTAKAVAKG